MYLRSRSERWIHLLLVSTALVPILSAMFASFRSVAFSTFRYDEYFMVTERAFGMPSFVLGRLVMKYTWFKTLLLTDYQAFIFGCFVAIGVTFAWGGIAAGYRTFVALLLSPLLAMPLYWFCPASGPGFAFSGYPFTVSVISMPHVMYLMAPPNCMPSNHMAMALLVAMAMWRWKAGKIIGSIHVVLTALATLGLGEHYFIDLIAAVPYAWFIYWLSMPFKVKQAVRVRRLASVFR
jgi:hypothetical protein